MIGRIRFESLALFLLVAAGAAFADGPRVAGRVVAAGGGALGEVEITLERAEGAIERRLREVRGEADAPLASTRSDAAGGFSLAAPAPGVYTLRLALPGFVPVVTELRPLLDTVELGETALRVDTGLTVSVVDASGRPVADAEVAVAEDAGRFAFEHGPWRVAPRRARTGPDGRVRFPHADRETTSISAIAAGRAPGRLQGHRGSAARLVLAVGRPSPVAIVAASGEPVSGALIALGEPPLVAARTGADGLATLVLEAGREVPITAATDDGRRVDARISPPPTPGGAPRSFVLAERLAVAGRVIDAESRRPPAGALVWNATGGGAWSATDGSGAFALFGPAGTRLRLVAGAPGYLETDPFELQLLDDGRPGPALALLPAAAIEGRVLDGDDRPVEGAAITVVEQATPGMMRFVIGAEGGAPRSRSDAEGRFRLSAIDPARAWDLDTRAEGFAPAREALGRLEPRRTRTGVSVRLDRGGAIAGTVVDAEGNAIAGASIVATSAAAASGPGRVRLGGPPPAPVAAAESDDDGAFRLAGLTAGRFDLEIRRRGFARRKLPAVEIEQPGATREVGAVELGPGETLQGLVVDDVGRPVEGAEIFLTEAAAGMAMMIGPRGGATEIPDAVTDPTGFFAIPDLAPASRQALRVARHGFVPASVAAIELPQGEPARVALEPASLLAGRVLDGDAKPVANAAVTLRRSRTLDTGGAVMRMLMSEDATSDAEGNFRFEDQEPGTVSLAASAPGFRQSRRDDLEIPKGDDLTGVELVLPHGAIVEGRIVAPDGRAAVGATVRPVRGDASEPLAVLESGAPSDGDGRYRLDGLEPGTHAIEATHPDFPRVVRDIELREGRNELDFAFEGGLEVAGTAVDESGTPVEGAALTLASPGRWFGAHETRSEAGGSFRFRGVVAGAYRLRASARGFAPAGEGQAVEVAESSVEGLRVRLVRGGSIVGRVLGIPAERLGDVSVGLDSGALPFGPPGRVDFEGQYRLDDVGPGRHTVVGRLSGSGRQARADVTLEPGQSEARTDLTFGTGLVLSGTARQGERALAGATVLVDGLEVDSSGYSQTDAAGRFTIDGLEPGSYRVDLREFSSGLAHSETVDLATSREIRIEVPATVVAGRVTDATDRAALPGVSITLEPARPDPQRPSPARNATTDAEGRFRIEGVSAGDWRMLARRDGYAASTLEVAIVGERGPEDLRLALEPTEGLTLEVALPGGGVPQDAAIAVLDASGVAVVQGTFATGEQGRVRLASVPAGSWTAVVAAGGAAVTQTRVQAPGPKIRVALAPACRLAIEVPELAGSNLVAVARVRAADGTPFRTLRWNGQPQTEWTLAGGRLELGSLPPGSWTVQVEAPGGRRWETTASTAPGAQATARLE